MTALALAVLLLAAKPAVTKVEPPGWWTGHSWNPVRVLVTGHDLQGAQLAARAPGLEVSRVTVSANGHYLFADVSIDAGTAPGPHPLRLTTAGGRVDVPFEIVSRPDAAGRYQGFTSDDVIYLLMPDRFANGDPSNDDPRKAAGLYDRARPRYYHGGDLQGVLDHLGYVKELGATAVWLNPWYDNNDTLNRKETYDGAPITDYHGYGAVDFYAVDEHLGDVATLRRLVDGAHAQGLKVVQDQVANHVGPYHPWVADPPTPTWFNGSGERHLANTWQTWTLQDPYSNAGTRRATLDGWFIDLLPDLNQDDPEVARYLIQNSLWWVATTGLDAIRQDTLPYVPRAFWRDWTSALRREHPQLTVLGELFDGDPVLVSYYQSGTRGLDGIDTGIGALFDFPLYYPVRRAFLEGKDVREVAQMLARDRLYASPSSLVSFLGLHDVSRFMGEKAATVDGLKLAWTFLLTTRGTPLVYYGDEIGLPGGGDPDNRRDFPGGWAADPSNAFRSEGRTPEQQAIWSHLATLTALRAGSTALRRGQLVNLLAEPQQYAYARVAGGDVAVVVLNNAAEPASLEIDLVGAGISSDGLAEKLGRATGVTMAEGRLKMTLPARSGAVLLRNP